MIRLRTACYLRSAALSPFPVGNTAVMFLSHTNYNALKKIPRSGQSSPWMVWNRADVQHILSQFVSLRYQKTCTLSSIKESLLVYQKWSDLFLFSSFPPYFNLEIEKQLLSTLWHMVVIFSYRKVFCILKIFKLPIRKSPVQVYLGTIIKDILWFTLAKLWNSGTWLPILSPSSFNHYISFRCSTPSLGPKVFRICVHTSASGIFLCCALPHIFETVCN